MKKIAVIGGGASGLSAAIEALRFARNTERMLSVTVFEALPRVGKKLLSTGNGRCNLGNTDIKPQYYSGDYELINSLISCDCSDTVSFFASLGVPIFEEDSRLYPISGQAAGVLDALRFESSALGANFIVESPVQKIIHNGDGYTIESEHFDAVIMSTGGRAAVQNFTSVNGYSVLQSLGHTVRQIAPALAPVKCSDTFFKSLKGIRINGTVELYSDTTPIVSEKGEIQFTEFGLSGIPVFNLSHLIKDSESMSFVLDLCPSLNKTDICSLMADAARRKPTVTDSLTGIIPKRLAETVFLRCGISPSELPDSLSSKEIEIVAYTVKHFSARITGVCGFDKAQVTGGGIDSNEINLSTLMSKKAQNLYICGELLDYCGKCGGYNLHLAWTSGRLAGLNSAKGLLLND